jgi:hypothetical protein
MIPLAIFRAVPWQAWLVLAGLAAGGVYHWRATSAAYEAGVAAATRTIIEANQKARDQADAAIKTVDDCFAAGGAWNRARGVCLRPGE